LQKARRVSLQQVKLGSRKQCATLLGYVLVQLIYERSFTCIISHKTQMS
jgi:hypothetical protein